MTDIDRGRIGGGEDRLPWLEPVEDEQPEGGVAVGKLIATVVVVLMALGLVIGGIFWLRERAASGAIAGGDGDLITAPKGDYKVSPANPGGMNVAGEGDATYAASQGVPVDAAIDMSKQPEAPVAGERAPAREPSAASSPAGTQNALAGAAPPTATVPLVAPVTKPAATPKPIETAKAPEPAKPTASGPAVQLGAFSSEAKAQATWSDLAKRFPALGSLPHSVSLAEVGGKKLYRLRASAGSGARASTVCHALTSAKEPCNVVG